MTALLKEEDGLYLTFEEYLKFEERSDIKHEYLDGYVYAMSGARREHNYIGANILALLRMQLRGKRCAALGPDQRLTIKLPGRTFSYYPDVTVDCSEKRTLDTEEPTVLFEITSPSTARGDRGDKLINYLNLPSLKAYAIVDQRRPHLTIHRRAADGTWRREVVSNLKATLALPEIECALALREIYDRVDFADASAE
ncbi:MAG TPA: Uma2 family endonuclease [Chthoniobacteraceae bacterium]|jgi:Uma2 family endonuclease|nr:Uma2 family endonuclease [Chthoniobacteraceae bacterium]